MKRRAGQAVLWDGSVPVKTILILMILLVFLSGLFVVLFVRSYVRQIDKEVQGVYRNTANIYVASVSDKISNYITAMGIVSLNQNIRKNIFRTDVSRSDMVDVGQELGESIDEMTFFLYRNTEIRSHFLYTYLPADGRYFLDIANASKQEWYNQFDRKNLCWVYKYSNVTRSNHLVLASMINAFGSDAPNVGNCYQTITIDTAILFAPISSHFSNMNAEIYIFDDASGKAIYGSDPALQEDAQAYFSGRSSNDDSNKIRIPTEDGSWFSPVVLSLDELDASALLLFRSAGLTESNDMEATFLVALAGVSFIVLLLAILLFYTMFAKRLESLIHKMDGFDEKDLLAQLPMGGYDEIARIDRHLLKMQGRITALIQEEYTAKMQIMQAQQEALIACINPHFLYNTLNSISAMACMEGADSSVEMIEALSDMFRYSSDVSHKEVTLQEELQNICAYLYIQSIRYENRFTYHLDIAEEFKNCVMPKLVLQPVVENAFKHGFRETSGLYKEKEIHVTAACKGEYVVLSVWDNGVGITPEKLEEMRTCLDRPDDAHLPHPGGCGLRNVHQRLRLLCGGDSGITVHSKTGEYTCVEIQMYSRQMPGNPESAKENAYAENLNCGR